MTPTPEAIRAAFDAVAAELLVSRRVDVAGFGTFELRIQKARRARNPRTGDRVNVPAKTVVRFKAAPALKLRAAAVPPEDRQS